MDALAGLNEEQRSVVSACAEPLLVLACVGSGKTRTLAHRAAEAINQGHAASEMLVVTFTNKAANEMRDRILALVPDAAPRMHISTFHAFCARVLREEAKTLALAPGFVIYDDEDQREVIRSVQGRMGGAWMGGEDGIQDIRDLISELKRRLLYPSSATARSELDREGREGYRLYQEILESNDALDFDDLVARTALFFNAAGPGLENWRRRFSWIEVDEIQDTADAEYEIVSQLGKNHRNLALFGDVEQSVYGWRGAKPGVVLQRFKKDFQPKELTLGVNYRSTKAILAAAQAVANAGRPSTELRTENPPGDRVSVHTAPTEDGEARFISNTIQDLVGRGRKYSDCAVLVRMNFQAAKISEVFEQSGVPHLTIEQYDFFKRMEVKDSVAYLRLIAYPRDSLALKRVLLRPSRGIGPVTIARLEEGSLGIGIAITDFVDNETIESGDPAGVLIDSWRNGTIVCLDVETTGTEPSLDEIVQVGAIKMVSGREEDRFECLVSGSRQVAISSSVHGISDEMRASEGRPLAEVIALLEKFVGKAVVVGHNVEFDLEFLFAAFGKMGLQLPRWKSFDTLALAKRCLDLDDFRLPTIAQHYGIAPPTHRADVDALVTSQVLAQLVGHLETTLDKRRELVKLHGERFGGLAKNMDRWRAQSSNTIPSELLPGVLEEAGYIDDLKRKDPAARRRLQNLDELTKLMARWEERNRSEPRHALRQFLGYCALASNVDRLNEQSDLVAVLTIHQAKGLEFPVVFVAGTHDGSIPSRRSSGDREKLEEERRLFYVAITRAKEKLYLTMPAAGRFPNRPSRFLNDIPSNVLHRIG
jgi:DNA helicase-2/ATP-dependent DNA helicase PcrA